MSVLSNNILCFCSNSTIYEFIVVRIGLYQMITIFGTPDKPCGGSVDANPKTCCQTIHDCQKVVPLHYESEWQYKYV